MARTGARQIDEFPEFFRDYGGVACIQGEGDPQKMLQKVALQFLPEGNNCDQNCNRSW